MNSQIWKVVESFKSKDNEDCLKNNADLSSLKLSIKSKMNKGDKLSSKESNKINIYLTTLIMDAKQNYEDGFYEDFGRKVAEIFHEL